MPVDVLKYDKLWKMVQQINWRYCVTAQILKREGTIH
jgi:hypothetical protein